VGPRPLPLTTSQSEAPAGPIFMLMRLYWLRSNRRFSTGRSVPPGIKMAWIRYPLGLVLRKVPLSVRFQSKGKQLARSASGSI